MSDKAPKAVVGYAYHPDTNYRCYECIYVKPTGTAAFRTDRDFAAGCAFFGPNEPISPQRGGCNAFIHGDTEEFDIPWLGLATKEELGYIENGPGFTCGRCEHMDVPGSDCEKVDKDSPGDTPGEINMNACCNWWGRDKERGGLSRDKLVQLVAKQAAEDPAGAGTLADYESRRKAKQ